MKHKIILVALVAVVLTGCKEQNTPSNNGGKDDWFETNWGFTTVYTPLIDNTDIPYVKYFNKELLMDKLDGDEYYTIYVYHTSNSSNTSGDTQCLKQKLTKTSILQYKDEHILTSDNG